MQFGRYHIEETTPRKTLPAEWTEEFTRVLTESYFEQSEKDNSFFHVYGEIYDKEFVVVISYIHHDDQLKSPISLFISHDVVENSKNFKDVLKNLVDLTGLIFDDIFSNADWNNYNSNWTENKYKDNEFHYKITRENISLSLQAEEILKKGGLV
ncbi:MAG: hypothetical protein QF441_07315 [Bacteriovoracaceae bacterium]|nr:hypothetical protein [Halobacteriovoraceae bacterium]MDP7320402.1 hypothetical protein [Bacteriovoracaceae bacterium]